MAETTTTADARRYLDGGFADVDQVLECRRQLRDQGAPALARALSRRLAERYIGGDALSAAQADAMSNSRSTATTRAPRPRSTSRSSGRAA